MKGISILYLSLLFSIGVISASLCAPALPFIADHFSLHFSHIQYTISLFLLGNALGQFLSGPSSDKWGSRIVLLGALFVYFLASVAAALSMDQNFLFGARFFQGMGSAAGPVLARAIAMNRFLPPRAVQMQSYGAVGVGLASIFSILLSGQLSQLSWRWSFWLAAFFGLFLFSWTCFAMKDLSLQVSKTSFRELFSHMRKILSHPIFLANALAHSFTYGLMYGYIALFPFLLKELFQEKNPAKIGLYSAYMIAIYMLAAFVASRFILRRKPRTVMNLGILIQLLGASLLMFAPSSFFFLAMGLFNASIGFILPISAAQALSPFIGVAVGTASSILGLFYRFIGAFLSALICQFPLSHGRNLGILMAVLSLCSLFVLQWMKRPSELSLNKE